jgi:hypothetical protein
VEPLFVPQEKLRSQGGFELLDPVRHARRDAMQLARRLDDATFFGDRLEYGEVSEIHSTCENSLFPIIRYL